MHTYRIYIFQKTGRKIKDEIHNDNNNTTIIINNTSKKVKSYSIEADCYKCKYCDFIKKGTTTTDASRAMKEHCDIVHHKIRYTCQLCPKQFKQLSNILRHMDTHTPCIPEYSCTYCNETFSTTENLFLHVFTHTGKLPFQCGSCPEQFLSSVECIKHMKAHSNTCVLKSSAADVSNKFI